MDQKTKKNEDTKITLPERVDTFNLEPILDEIKEGLSRSSTSVTLNLTETRFVNLPFIKKLAQMAVDAQESGKGLTLLNASEKVKKQIGIFSEIKLFQIQREILKSEWPALDESAGS